MAEYHIAKADYTLKINGTYENTLDIEGFAQMMKDPSYCYKFYWLEAIVDLISRDIAETTFDEIINEMIANAWYSVREFHIHLSGIQADGMVRDGLERAIQKLTEISALPANASKVEIRNAISEHDKELKQAKEQVWKDSAVLPSARNKEVIRILQKKRMFEIKNSVEQVAHELNISVNTVYFHLRNIAKAEETT